MLRNGAHYQSADHSDHFAVGCQHNVSFFLLYRDSKIPDPPQGHKWKEVRHDNRVTWLSSWTENIQGSVKYVMLNAASKLKVRNRGGVVFRPAV